MRRAQRNSAERRKPVLALLAVLGAGLVYAVACGRHGVQRYLELRRDLDRRGGQAYQRIERNRDMLERLQGLRTDDRVLEEVARSTLGVVDENEIVIVFRDPQGMRRP